jgi:secondary thiamine-phosphate synthase enzyme
LDRGLAPLDVAGKACPRRGCRPVHHPPRDEITKVRYDLERFAARLAPDGDPLFRHHSEGPDDMPAHIRSILTLTSLSIPVEGGRCDLGTWQGVFVWEHRTHPPRRRITVTVIGDIKAP